MRLGSFAPLPLIAFLGCTSHVHDPAFAPPAAPQAAPAPTHRDATAADPRLLAALDRAKEAMRPLCAPGCGDVALVVSTDIEAAAHLRSGIPGYSLIEVRADYVDQLLVSPQSVLLWVVAHEYGHHLDLNSGRGTEGGEWAMELRAEALAGCALARTRMPVEPVLAISHRSEAASGSRSVLADQFGSDGSHPHWRHMRVAILAGHAACTSGSLTIREVAASVTEVTRQALQQRSPLLRQPHTTVAAEPHGDTRDDDGMSPVWF